MRAARHDDRSRFVSESTNGTLERGRAIFLGSGRRLGPLTSRSCPEWGRLCYSSLLLIAPTHRSYSSLIQHRSCSSLPLIAFITPTHCSRSSLSLIALSHCSPSLLSLIALPHCLLIAPTHHLPPTHCSCPIPTHLLLLIAHTRCS
jgi:hypothetical protein